MNNNVLKINTDNLSDESISIDELYNFYKEELKSKDILCYVNNPKNFHSIKGSFEEDIWAIYRDTTKTYSYLDFENCFTYNKLSYNEKVLIKCWISNILLENFYKFDDSDNSDTIGRTSEDISTYLNLLKEFLIISNNLSYEFLNNSKGDNIESFFLDKCYNSSYTHYKRLLAHLLSYFEFRLFSCNLKDICYDEKNYKLYYRRIYNLHDMLSPTDKPPENSRTFLPSGTDILFFDYYINKFFNDDTIDEYLKLYYYPILIWWKLSNVIPLRVSELCIKIPRDCLFIENDKYYLKINRVKKRNQTNRILPVLTEFCIDKDTYNLISYYIKKTDIYGSCKCLFSYKAYRYLRSSYLIKKYPSLYSQTSDFESNSKYNTEYFTGSQLNLLLTIFYQKIIGEYYHDTFIEDRLTPSDTRHLAFTYLILQKIPIVEVAILGGHSDTKTVCCYTGDANPYRITETFKRLNQGSSSPIINKHSILDIVYDMPTKCSIPIEKCEKTSFSDIELGYCTAQNEYDCESYYCYYCSKWYCSPTIDSANKLLKIVQKDLDKRANNINNNIEFLIKLFKGASTLYSENTDKEVCLEKDLSIQLSQLSLQIQADTEQMLKISTNLLSNVVNVDDSKLDIINKLRLLENSHNKNTAYLIQRG